MNFFCAYLLIGGMIQMTASQVTPEMTFISPKQIGQIGGTAELQCSGKNVEHAPLLWVKSGEYIFFISSERYLVVRDSRYSLRYNETSSTSTLKINDLRLEDAGRYQCMLYIAPGNQPATDVDLEVRQTEMSDNKLYSTHSSDKRIYNSMKLITCVIYS